MRPPDRFETERLLLRRPTLRDAQAMFAGYTGDPEVTRYLRFRPHQSVAETRAFLRRCAQFWRTGSAFPWTILRRGDGQLMGAIQLRPDLPEEGPFRMEAGYVLARAHWGQGYMTEALRTVTDWAIGQRNVYRVWAVCDVENPASARVMEKAGFDREGLLRRFMIHPNRSSLPRDVLCYARVK